MSESAVGEKSGGCCGGGGCAGRGCSRGCGTSGLVGFVAKCLAITLLAVVAGSGHSWRTPVTLKLEDASPGNTSPAAPDKAATGAASSSGAASAEQPLPIHLTLEQAKALFDKGSPFIDAREEHEREEGWIKGSVHLTAGMMSGAKLPGELDLLNPDDITVIYCAGGTCDASENLAILLKQFGFTKLHIFHDGFPAWQAAGYPIEKGAPK